MVATTRPETMLGDTAVAVHPEDERYKALIGKNVRLPIADRLIPIVADDYADPEKGSGAVKITPATTSTISRWASATTCPDQHPRRLRPAERRRARALPRPGPLRRAQADRRGDGGARPAQAGRGNPARGAARRLPFRRGHRALSDRPMVRRRLHPGAAGAIKAVEEGKTVFEPKNWEKTYFEWLRNIEPWCISRQLWWSHRIPAWYRAGRRRVRRGDRGGGDRRRPRPYGSNVPLTQDEDVLDTWFSSALWPISRLWAGQPRLRRPESFLSHQRPGDRLRHTSSSGSPG